MPYIIFLLILKYISWNVVYVFIFLMLLMLFITFISSKIQNKKSFVKYSRRKADYSRTAEIIRELSVSFTNVLHFLAQKWEKFRFDIFLTHWFPNTEYPPMSHWYGKGDCIPKSKLKWKSRDFLIFKFQSEKNWFKLFIIPTFQTNSLSFFC